ncbi:MAG: hypothetical protein KatS3mg030_194 [Saprospiraceae bacterium]|jgi:mannose-6-phosphate isomerase-like protein (cupin superfamily)|nr:MAG: hypothetical protein KatS3mg030_189 [Saprospiraceae bacterium]GIV31892.1 MAG: hypothetical protein KatS3mg030_194 [Saprospiraceae bacterium]
MHDKALFERMRKTLAQAGFRIVDSDEARPWGGFFVIDEGQASRFIEHFFPTLSAADFAGIGKLSPKILLVAPGQRLSWQYHHRRSELWRVIQGRVGVVRSLTDEEGPLEILEQGDMVSLAIGERHRLVGLDDWGALAEIWKHADPLHPSDEDDIVRLQDDYGRQAS